MPLLYVEQSYHMIHCMYTIKKMHRAFLRQTMIDDYISGEKHTVHCSDIVLQNIDWKKFDTVVGLNYPTCGDLNTIVKSVQHR